MIICVPAAHVYRYPDITSEHIDEAVYGTECEILDEINGFYRVDLSYGYRGYVLKSDICAPAAKATRPHFISQSKANILAIKRRVCYNKLPLIQNYVYGGNVYEQKRIFGKDRRRYRL